MGFAQRELKRQKWCDECDRNVLAVEQQPNREVHLMLSLITCGLYLPVALVLLSIGELSPRYLCPRCGDQL